MATKPKRAVAGTPRLYDRIRNILESARARISRTVNTTQVVATWLIGRQIVEDQQQDKKRAGYGKGRPANSNAVRAESPGSQLSDANSDAVRRKSDASGAARYVAG